MTKTSIAEWVLRVGVAFAFLYPPFNALGDPASWIGYFPGFVQGVVPDEVLLHSFGIVEVVLALWILSGWKIIYPCFIAAAMLIAIVMFNSVQFQILFRDLSIAAMAVGLGLMQLPKRREVTTN